MNNLLTFLPFSSPWIVRHHLGTAKSVLDVGCGDGEFMLKVNPDKKYEVVGIDLFKPNIKKAKQKGVYKKVLLSDLRKINFKKGSFDIVLASQVIEHINKKEGLKMLSVIERIARKRIVVYTPNGFVPFDPFEVMDDNPLQVHKSGWGVGEMRKHGYRVYGQGNKRIYNTKNGLLYRFRRLKNILVIISFLLAPISYFIPETSSMIVAVKDK